MNYNKHYELLIERAQNRQVEGYTEKHHILPRCLGGTDNPHNFARLTPEEHFVAHQLLIKLHPRNAKIIYAVLAMTMTNKWTGRRCNNKLFGWLRRELSKPRSQEICDSISRGRKGMKFSAEHRANISRVKKGFRFTDEQKVKLSIAGKGKNAGKVYSPEHRAKLSESKKLAYAEGRMVRTPEHQAKLNLINSTRDHSVPQDVRDKISASLMGRPQPRTKEHQDRLTESLRGKKRTEEQKARMRVAQQNRPPRKPHSEETKIKMRLAAQQRAVK